MGRTWHGDDYLADAMNEIKHSLESEIEALRLKVDSLTDATVITAKPATVAAKATDIKPACPVCGTNDYVISHGAVRWMCKKFENYPGKKSKNF
ncbi:hypothetical protein [Nostoc sp.]|uniref:hypothetical protein n=1 Tax=Nostoc sp. TaxID=1180 RepID=UPI002FF76B33